MNEEKVEKLIEVLSGMTQQEWLFVHQKVSMHFSSIAAKVELDDMETLKKSLTRKY